MLLVVPLNKNVILLFKMKVKDTYIQAIKGLCIIFVVMIHLPFGNENSEIGAYLWIAARKTVNFAVATFFFLSAYYTKPYKELKTTGLLSFYRKRFTRLLVPYMCWSVIYVFIVPLIREGHIAYNWVYLLWSGSGPLYFLLALSQLTILSPFIQKYKGHPVCNFLFWIITPTYLLFYYLYNFKTGEEFKPEQFFCFPWFAAYYLGLKLQDIETEKLKNYPILILALVFGALLFSLVEGIWIYHSTRILSFAISQITGGSIMYSLCIILLLYMGKGQFCSDTSFLSKIGDYSMGIFLIHPTFNWIYKFVICHLPISVINYASPTGYMFSHILILVLSVTSSYYTAKYLSNTFPTLNLYLGLK